MTDSSNVVKLSDTKAGFNVESNDELFDWLSDWAGAIKNSKKAKTLILVVETTDGDLYRVAQGIVQNDGSRLIGLLSTLTHRMMDGGGQVPEL